MRRTVSGYRLIRDGPAVPAPEQTTEFTTAEAIYRLFRPLAEVEVVESFWVLPLNGSMRMCHGGWFVISRGLVNLTLAHPREIFRPLIVVGAVRAALVHNHPSGNLIPSAGDRTLTVQAVQAGQLLDIPIVDHVIISATGYYSFSEQGLL